MGAFDINRPTLLIGIGNEFRSDDGVGIVAARIIGKKDFPGIAVAECAAEARALQNAWSGKKSVVIVAAVSSGTSPGTIHRIDARRQPVSEELFRSSADELGLANAVEMARSAGKLPADLIIYGIEGRRFVAGTSLSPEVLDALNEVVQLVTGELFSLPDGVLQNS